MAIRLSEPADRRRIAHERAERRSRLDHDEALEKDRTRRAFRLRRSWADIARHLRHEPVLAGPPATTYRIGKFVRRHRLGVAACAAVLMALLVGLAGTALLARGVEAVAAAEAETARQVSDFLIGSSRCPIRNQARGNTITAREILEAGVGIDRELADRPLVRARLMDTTGGCTTSRASPHAGGAEHLPTRAR